MKKYFLTLLLIVFLPLNTLFSQSLTNRSDIVVLMDNSQNTLPYYDDINKNILSDILLKFVHKGDNFHLLTFSGKPSTEITRTVQSDEEVEKLRSRLNLLYQAGQYSDFPSALQYAQTYISSLDIYTSKVLIIISDGQFKPQETSYFAKKKMEMNFQKLSAQLLPK